MWFHGSYSGRILRLGQKWTTFLTPEYTHTQVYITQHKHLKRETFLHLHKMIGTNSDQKENGRRQNRTAILFWVRQNYSKQRNAAWTLKYSVSKSLKPTCLSAMTTKIQVHVWCLVAGGCCCP
jgi:hypothetical protein